MTAATVHSLRPADDEGGREPPQAPEAEDSVLGACLISDKAADVVLDICRPDWLYRESSRVVLGAVASLRAKGKTADAISIEAELEATGMLDRAGDRGRVKELACLVPTTANVGRYVEIVRDTAVRRDLIRTGQRVANVGWDGVDEPDRMVEQAEEILFGLRTAVDHGRSPESPSMQDRIAELGEQLANPPTTDGIPTPFRFLPALCKSRLYLLGGYSGEGKSCLAVQFARTAAEAGANVGFVSLEMSGGDLTDRLLATYGIPYRQIANRRPVGAIRDSLGQTMSRVAKLPLTIDDECRTAEDIVRLQRVRRFDFLIIDHFHELPSVKIDELERDAETIRRLAMDAGIPVLMVAQFHRPMSTDTPPRPTKLSFKGTGALEQKAAAAWAVYAKRDDARKMDGRADFIILKNRYGGKEGYSYSLQHRTGEERFVEEVSV